MEDLIRDTREIVTSKIVEWYKSEGRSFPWRKTNNPYHVLLSEMMLQRTNANQVAPVYDLFIKEFPTVYDAANASLETIKDFLQPLGISKRAVTFHRTFREIIDRFDGIVPDDLDNLLSLTGIGNYTARATLCFAFGKNIGILDNNIVRVLKRLYGFYTGVSRAHCNKDLLNTTDLLVSEKDPQSFNYGLLDFSSKICNVKPKCDDCFLSGLCWWNNSEIGKASNENYQYTLIDLFSGAGGMTEGFKQVGFLPVFAVEMDKSAADSYEANFGAHVFRGQIEHLRRIPTRVDVVIGGPPCQGFSPLGKMNSTDMHIKLNTLWRHFMAVVEHVVPTAFVMENVPEILRSHEYLELHKMAEKMSYKVKSVILNANDFGVAQKRKRAFIVGILNTEPIIPKPMEEKKTLREVIGHMPIKPNDINWHIGRNPTEKSKERYRVIPPGGNRFDLIKKRPDLAPPCWLKKKTGSTDVFGRLEWDKPALTIRTEFFKPEKGRYLHPKDDRPITHREAALIQSFPENFQFRGSKIEVAKQIGNAVPPKLAEAIAKSVKEILDEIYSSNQLETLNVEACHEQKEISKR